MVRFLITLNTDYRFYLLISLIRDFILSNDGLQPPVWSMSSMGTELNTIDVITLRKHFVNFRHPNEIRVLGRVTYFESTEPSRMKCS